MSVRKRNGAFFIYFRPFGEKLIGVKTAARTKSEAKLMEIVLLTACRSRDFSGLDAVGREICVRMFRNQGWEIPPDLLDESEIKQELTLWRSIDIFLNYPTVRDCKAKERYLYALKNLVLKIGKERPVKDIWAPQIRQYQAERLAGGASPTTVNWETSTLSRMFRVLIELKLVDTNPVRLVEQLSRKSSEREVYLALNHVLAIASLCPAWFKPIVLTAFFTGMRRGEVLGLRRQNVKLSRRIIILSPEETKEGHWKRVPIHQDLVPILEREMRVTSLESDRLFLIRSKDGVRPPHFESLKNPWRKACETLKLNDPSPRFHDLRHTWKTNARRSGMDPEIREAILGHASRERSVRERYGRISDEELLQAIDSTTFDHGETEILVAKKKNLSRNASSRRGLEKMLTGC